MAEMTAAEAIRIALKFNQFDVAGVITRMTTHLDVAKQKELAYKQVIEGKKALLEQQAQEIERLNKSLQFEQNYLSRVGTHGPDCYKWGPGHWDCAMQEIAKLNYIAEQYSKNGYALADEADKDVARLEREIAKLRDLHRSILWFVEEHKKIQNCKKWMPLIEEKAMMAIYPDEAANLKD